MGRSEYQEHLDEAVKEAPNTGVKIFFIGIVVLLVGFGLYFFGSKLNIFSTNIQRENIQHSNEYTETKVSLLSKLHNDWLTLDTEIAELSTQEGQGNDKIIEAKKAQQKEIINRMKEEASRIPSSEIPKNIKEFLRNH